MHIEAHEPLKWLGGLGDACEEAAQCVHLLPHLLNHYYFSTE